MEKNKKEELMQVIKFTLFSISAGVIQLASYALLFSLIGLPEWFSHLVSLVLSVLWNFTLNREYTFKSANNVKIAMLKVAVFYIIFTPTSTWLVKFLTKIKWNAYLVEGLVMALNFILEFLYCKFFVYRGSINTKQKSQH